MEHAKQLINAIKHVDTWERIAHIRDIFKDETVYIVTCGPTLTQHDRQTLINKLSVKFLISCKQAYEYIKEIITIHCLSVYNYQDYDYVNDDIIRHWQFTASNIDDEIRRVQTWNQRIDLLLPVYSTPWVQKYQTTAYTRNFDNWKLYSNSQAVWGPGIMYESAFPMAVHMGCKRIVTIGWDIGDISRYDTSNLLSYDNDWLQQHAVSLYKTDTGSGPEYEELKNTIECTNKMYDWFTNNNIEVQILSNTNPADERFKRITINEL